MFFFFFNDTATTEIYTLSLHDALPIFAFARCPIRVAQGIRNVLWPMTFRRREAQRAGRQTVEDLGKDGAPFRDRKSTRLNSSHLVNSYAVFCLQKKNSHDRASDRKDNR